jgi:hypothetical protein
MLSNDLNVAGIRSEEEYFIILRNRVMWCICKRLQEGKRTFHAVDLVNECAGGFYDQRAAAEFEFRGSQEEYSQLLRRVYTPLVEQGMLEEYENNNYKIPEGSALERICERELSGGREYINYENIDWS